MGPACSLFSIASFVVPLQASSLIYHEADSCVIMLQAARVLQFVVGWVLFLRTWSFLSRSSLAVRTVDKYHNSLLSPLTRIPPKIAVLASSLSDIEYGTDAITVLTGLEPVRKRPGMYIGTTGPKGLHHLVFEVVDNSVDEALAGHCDTIHVTIHPDNSIEVRDNGRGIPCGLHPQTGKSSLETVLCVLHAGGKFGGEASGYQVSGGLHGVGISVVNALSEVLTVEVVRDGQWHAMSFSRGIPTTELQVRPAAPEEIRGTRVHFKPDADIFKVTTEFDSETLATRLDELAYLNAGEYSLLVYETLLLWFSCWLSHRFDNITH